MTGETTTEADDWGIDIGDEIEWTESWGSGAKKFRGTVVGTSVKFLGSELIGDDREVISFDLDMDRCDDKERLRAIDVKTGKSKKRTTVPVTTEELEKAESFEHRPEGAR